METIEKQMEYFEKLSEQRDKTITEIMNSFALRNLWNGIIDKYSEEAHFIYELLQNANDAKATTSAFDLTANGLYFKHNGQKHFWVSNPNNEDQDQKNGNLGDINAITAVAQSNKDQLSVGKFGVGFKSVFQYTKTPHIYDPNFQFKITSYIVPEKLKNDLVNREKNETVFYFPFDKEGMPAERAFNEILGKLKDLSYPTLFLPHLKEIKWKSEIESGSYTKKISNTSEYDNISYSEIDLSYQIGLNQKTEKILLLSRTITDSIHTYSVGFFLDDKNQLSPKTLPAFCFFPTKEQTGLNFIIHAPFLLTDSREGIKRLEHNTKMVKLLAGLAADSLLVLKDLKYINDNIVDIIPYKKADFYKESISYGTPPTPKLFAPFFHKIKNKLLNKEILPSKDETFTKKQNAYWAEYSPITDLFSNSQLAQLIGDENVKWIFPSISRNGARQNNSELGDYIEDLIKDYLDIEYVLRKYITTDFIEKQGDAWIHKFYEYLSKSAEYLKIAKTKPIFKDTKGKAVAAFEQKGKEQHPILFLPSKDLSSYYTQVHPDFLKNEKTKEFLEKFGIKEPSLKDEIYNQILPEYDTDEGIDTAEHFQKFFNYYKQCPTSELQDYIDLIKDKGFIRYYSCENGEEIFRGSGAEIYFPSPELILFFENKIDTYFLDVEFYNEIVEENHRNDLRKFLLKIGVNETVVVEKKEKNWDGCIINNNNHGFHQRGLNGFDKNITVDGLKEALSVPTFEISKFIWNSIALPHQECIYGTVQKASKQNYSNGTTEIMFSENFGKLLTKIAWLPSKEGIFLKPSEFSLNDLPEGFILNVDLAVQLGIKDCAKYSLTQNEKIAELLLGRSETEIKRALELFDKQNKHFDTKNYPNNNDYGNLDNIQQTETQKLGRTIKDLDSLQNEYASEPKIVANQNTVSSTPLEISFDEDEEFIKGIKDLKAQLETKQNRVNLAETIKNSEKYSYVWFKAYLELLTTYVEQQDSTTKQKTISFQKIERYKDKYFLLCGASSYVSPEIENADNFKITVIFGNGKKENLIVESVSKKGQDLLICVPASMPEATLARLSNIFKVEISFTPVIDLLDRLCKAFANNKNIDEWTEINKSLPALNYIYGPPGTGKTTTVCDKIVGILKSNPNAKFLVLTPTNKAADVVCKKLYETNSNISLVRLSKATDPDLEEGIYKDTIESADMKKINVVASTIHRLPYFDIQNAGLLFQYKWDYVIFDESSMIGLHYITFAIMALFKSNQETKFIIAGDPKQIPPVIGIDDKDLESADFQDENIYKMMGLESFVPEEQSIRDIDTIANLDTQYRSVPQIGRLFSELSYSGLLKHDREENRTESKPLPEKIKKIISSNVTFIDIPLDRDKSIYKVSKLIYSSYQTYCAILVAEIIKYFDDANLDKEWTIGLIAPYKAQALLLNKLVTSYGISENVKVYSDTVHGFQGDECDIVFFVCNPNNYSYTGHPKSLLSKEYIYNVAISRAKDYLVILHPYSEIQKNEFINKIGASFKKNFGNANILGSSEVEKVLFDEKNHIENNSYVSGHDNVNVFGFSEMKYIIKANDTAIDIQLRNLKTEGISKELTEDKKSVQSETPKFQGLTILGHIDVSDYKRK